MVWLEENVKLFVSYLPVKKSEQMDDQYFWFWDDFSSYFLFHSCQVEALDRKKEYPCKYKQITNSKIILNSFQDYRILYVTPQALFWNVNKIKVLSVFYLDLRKKAKFYPTVKYLLRKSGNLRPKIYPYNFRDWFYKLIQQLF